MRSRFIASSDAASSNRCTARLWRSIDAAGLTYEREVALPAVYKGRLLGQYRIDFIVEDRVIVEVKSVERMNPVFDTQILMYLRIAKKRVGLLINFNSSLLKDGVKRIIV